MMKKLILSVFSAALVAFSAATATAAHHEGAHNEDPIAPKSVIHVVTVTWKASATPAQIQAALDGVKTLAKEYDGISRVWTHSFKAQGRPVAFVMEFKSRKALEDYAGSPAQQKWYESYMAVREGSTTFDITNK